LASSIFELQLARLFYLKVRQKQAQATSESQHSGPCALHRPNLVPVEKDFALKKGAISELLNLMSKGWQNRFNFQFDSAIVWKRIIVPQTLPLP